MFLKIVNFQVFQSHLVEEFILMITLMMNQTAKILTNVSKSKARMIMRMMKKPSLLKILEELGIAGQDLTTRSTEDSIIMMMTKATTQTHLIFQAQILQRILSGPNLESLKCLQKCKVMILISQSTVKELLYSRTPRAQMFKDSRIWQMKNP